MTSNKARILGRAVATILDGHKALHDGPQFYALGQDPIEQCMAFANDCYIQMGEAVIVLIHEGMRKQ